MNFCELGTRVSHRKYGNGKVVRLLGTDDDEGVRIKLDSGKTMTVHYTDQGLPSWKRPRPQNDQTGWRRSKSKTESRAKRVVSALLDDRPSFPVTHTDATGRPRKYAKPDQDGEDHEGERPHTHLARAAKKFKETEIGKILFGV